MSLGKKILAGSVIAIAVLLALAVVGVLFVAPAVARSVAEDRISRIENKLGLEITTSSIDTVGLGGVEVKDLQVVDTQTGRTIVTVATAGAKVSVAKAIIGERVVTDLWSRDVVVSITREADGEFDIVGIAKRARGDKKADEAAAPTGDEPKESAGMLRYFGGTLPEVDVSNVSVNFAAVDGAPPFPVQSLTLPILEIAHEDTIDLRAKFEVASDENSQWSLPSQVNVTASFDDDDLSAKALDVDFDRPVEVVGLEPVAFLRAGFAGVGLSPEGLLTVTDAHLGFASAEEPFAKTSEVSLAVARWSLNPRNIVFANLTVNEPHMDLHYDRHGANELSDLDHALRAPRARDIATSARRFADELAQARKEDEEPPPPDDGGGIDGEERQDEQPEPAPEQADPVDNDEPSRLEKLLARLPHEVIIKGAVIDADDERDLPVTRLARKLKLDKGEFSAVHNIADGTFRVEGGFEALADNESRGKVHGHVELGYRTKELGADVEVDALDLSWLGQILGARAANKLRGGTLRAKLDIKRGKGSAVTVDGNVSVEDLVFFWDLLAEEPIEDFTASYGFSATYDPKGKMPASRLLKHGLYRDKNTPAPDDPIHAGSLVFTKGNARMGQAQATVLPAIYGTGALPSRLPARFDLKIDLPSTPAQVLFDSVPVAIQGPLNGTQMAGTFAWQLDLELPPYRAAAMQWVSTPVLEEFELIEIPKAVDPNNLMKGWKHTITAELTDDDGEEYEWSRTVKIPPAKPISAKYLIDNTPLELDDLDERRREREWPEVPDPSKSYMPRTLIESPDYWLTASAEAKVAPRPWNDGDTIEWSEKQPLGPYTFVPLHHISPYAVRTVTTTEDGGFFKHPGFLFDALKDSVEDNIVASRFRRGGSTISMQLVKNAFLDHKKLLARKIREAFLVFLMEHVVDVPKSRILEVYFNIIEFGPGIYGIHDGALHYFGKRPDELTMGEVSFLFSILPSPKRYHVFWERDKIGDRWFSRMKRHMGAMLRREKITQEEYDAATVEPPMFYKPDLENGEPLLKPAADPFADPSGLPLLFGDPNAINPTTPSNPSLAPTPTGTPTPVPPDGQKKKKKKKRGFFGF